MSQLLAQIADAWRPPEPFRHAEWIPNNVYVPKEGESPVPFNLLSFPHALGVLEAFDDPMIREIILPWGAQVGKTIVGLSLLASTAVNSPRPMLAGRETQEGVETKLFEEQLVPLLEATVATRKLLKPKHLRKKSHIDIGNCRIRGVYPGAIGSMAGFPAAVGHCSECTKWPHQKRDEAHPLELVDARFTQYPFDQKCVKESTPGEQQTCKITQLAQRDGVLILRRMVPCPHCGTYQLLVFGDRDPESPGLKWQKNAKGRSEPALAERTAYYQCAGNKCRIENVDRDEMLRNGEWLAESQTITNAKVKDGRIIKRGTIEGDRPAASIVSFGDPEHSYFGAMYSLSTAGWGFIAIEFFNKSWHQFSNSVLGKVHNAVPKPVKPNELAERLRSEIPRGTIPDDVCFLTLSSDTGASGTDLWFYWMVTAWRNDGTGHVVDWGAVTGDSNLWAQTDEYQSEIIGIDSGGKRDSDNQSVTERVYAIVKNRRNCWPLKGSSNDLGADWYNDGFQRSGTTPNELKRKRRAGLSDLIIVNSMLTQSYRENMTQGRDFNPGDRGFVTLPAEVAEDPEAYADFLEEFTNDVLIDGQWKKRGGKPNEFGDCLRYARVLAEKFTSGGKRWGKLKLRDLAKQRRPAKRKPAQKPTRRPILGGHDRPQLTPR